MQNDVRFQIVEVYQCIECSKIYITKPSKCTCDRVYAKGKQVGVFLLERRISDTDWLATCTLCGVSKQMAYTNLKRMKSCGCKPRYISLLSVSNNGITYLCRRCGERHENIEPPVWEWCCE